MTPKVEELVAGHDALDTNHKHIWLSPRCEDERTWCQDDQGGCDECGEPSVKYVRADIAETLSSRVMELEALQTAAQALVAARFDHYRAGNNRMVGIQDDSGEKCWIVPFDAMADLERALQPSPIKE